jgi:hypothetical protein
VYLDNSYSPDAAALPGSTVEDKETSLISYSVEEFNARVNRAVGVVDGMAPASVPAPVTPPASTPYRMPTVFPG